MTSQTQSGKFPAETQARKAVTSDLLERRGDGTMTIVWKDADGRVVNEITMYPGGAINEVWKGIDGAVERTVEKTKTPDGGEIGIEKDPSGRVTGETRTDRNGMKTVTLYGQSGEITRVSRYDAAGDLLSEQISTLASDGATPILIDTFYKNGAPVRKTATFPGGVTDDLPLADEDAQEPKAAAPMPAPAASEDKNPVVSAPDLTAIAADPAPAAKADPVGGAVQTAPAEATAEAASKPPAQPPVSNISLPVVEDLPATDNNPAGKKTSFYKGNRLARTLEAYEDGSSISTIYGRDGKTLSAKGVYPDGSTEEVFYDRGIVVRTILVEDGVRTETLYEDGIATTIRETHPDGHSGEAFADGSSILKYPDGRIVETAFRDADSGARQKAVSVTEPDGATRVALYDLVQSREICRYVEEKRADGTTLTSVFGPQGNIATLSIVNPRGETVGTETYGSDGEIAQRQQRLDDGSWLTTEFEMEAPSVITVKQNPDGTQTYTEIDAAGKAVSVHLFAAEDGVDPVALDLSQAVYPRPILPAEDSAPEPDRSAPPSPKGGAGGPRVG